MQAARQCVRAVALFVLGVLLGHPLTAAYVLLADAGESCRMACCQRDKQHCARAKKHAGGAAVQAGEGCGPRCGQCGAFERTPLPALVPAARWTMDSDPGTACTARAVRLASGVRAQIPLLPRPPPQV